MKKLFMFLVRGYQKFISPLFPATCRYHPTCSQYTLVALDKHGALKGSIMGMSRIIRCNPFVEGGIDPVPDYFTLKRQYPKDKEYLEESKWNDLQILLSRYHEDVHIQHQPLTEVLSDFIDMKPIAFDSLDNEYIKQLTEDISEFGIEDPAFSLFEIVSMKDTGYDAAPPFESPLNFAANNLQTQFVLVEKELGIIKASQADLAVDLVLAYGVTEMDMNEQTPRLHHYLMTLDRLEV